MNSKNKYQINISFNQKLEGLQLTVIDGMFTIVFEGNSECLQLELDPGVYQLKAVLIDYYQEYLLLVDSNKSFRFDFNYPAVAPILSFRTTHEYFSQNAELYSQMSTVVSSEDHPDFLLFAAKYDKDMFPDIIMENLLPHYSIIKNNNEILYQFGPENAKYNSDYGWLAFSGRLPEGQYLLKWTDGNDSRIFPFCIFDGFQTQFFIRYSSLPDFENCFFFYTKKRCFNADAEEYLVLDKILFTYRDYSNFKLLTEKDHSIIRQHPYLMTLIHILQLELSEKLDYENCQLLLLPDLILLSDKLQHNGNDEQLPVISSIMNKYSNNTIDKKMPFKPGSLIDRAIDHVKYDLFWNNFSKIDNVQEWIESYTKMISESDKIPISTKDNQIIKLGKKLINSFSPPTEIVIENRLNSLIGEIHLENLETNVANTINSIGNVSEVAAKLNLPATQVLRNYDTYKDIYDKLNQSPSEITNNKTLF